MKTSFSGKSVDAAVAKAAESMGVSPADLNYEVLAGQGGGFALIKVLDDSTSVAPAMVETLTGVPGPSDGPPREDRDRDRPPRPPRRDHSDGRRERSDRGDDRRGGGRDRGGRGPRRDGDRRDRGDRGGEHRRRESAGPLYPGIPEDAPTEATGIVAEGVELTPVAQEAFDILLGLLNRMEFGVEVVANEDVLNVTFNIQSEVFHPILVCRDLEVLNALEQLVDRMIFQEGEDDRLRFHVDSQGVKEQKDLDLSQAALDMAEEAIAKGSTMKIGPLDSRARRMVHLALKEHGGVTTHSEGQGAFRRVCIVPNE